MLRQWFIAGLLVVAAAVTAPAQTTLQPNRGADVTIADPTPPSSGSNLQNHATIPSPGSSLRDPAVSSSSISHTPLVLAPSDQTSKPSPDPNEKRALGAGTSSNAHTGAAKAPDEAQSSWMFTTITALACVIGLILVLRLTISKLTGRAIASSHSPVVEVLSRTSVAPKNQVLLLRLGRRILVVGDSTAGLSTLADIADPEEVAGLLQAVAASKPGSSTSGFSSTLEGFDGQFDEEMHGDHTGSDGSEHRVDRARDSVRGLLSRLRHAGKGEPL